MNDLKTVNEKKTRIDHETGNIHATLAYNNRQEDNVMHTVNKVITFDMAAAVATEFDTDATDDESLKVGMVSAVTEQKQPIKQTEMNSC